MPCVFLQRLFFTLEIRVSCLHRPGDETRCDRFSTARPSHVKMVHATRTFRLTCTQCGFCARLRPRKPKCRHRRHTASTSTFAPQNCCRSVKISRNVSTDRDSGGMRLGEAVWHAECEVGDNRLESTCHWESQAGCSRRRPTRHVQRQHVSRWDGCIDHPRELQLHS